MSRPELDRQVEALVSAYQARLHAVLPHRLEGLLLFGSIALDDYRPGQSDIDFLAVSTAPWTGADLAALAATHEALASAWPIDLDGVYVTWSELASPPGGIDAPHSLGGRFSPRGAFDANVAVWETVARYGRSVCGPARPAVYTDPAALLRWSKDNLATYWRGVERGLAAVAPVRPATDAELAWCVSGVARLAYTIGTGDICSKTAALDWTLDACPGRWATLVAAARAARTQTPRPAGVRPVTTAELGRWMDEAIEAATS